MRAKVLLHVEVVHPEGAILQHGLLEHEHLAQVEQSHGMVVLEDGVDVACRRHLDELMLYHALVAREQVAADVGKQLVGRGGTCHFTLDVVVQTGALDVVNDVIHLLAVVVIGVGVNDAVDDARLVVKRLVDEDGLVAALHRHDRTGSIENGRQCLFRAGLDHHAVKKVLLQVDTAVHIDMGIDDEHLVAALSLFQSYHCLSVFLFCLFMIFTSGMAGCRLPFSSGMVYSGRDFEFVMDLSLLMRMRTGSLLVMAHSGTFW